jgi:alkylhydroperoxidase/carboxymuconolactone decarboxylase family protein YurZ
MLWKTKVGIKKVYNSFPISSFSKKALIALAVASAIYEPYCIETYCNDAREYGWKEQQIPEAMQVAAAVQCGFASVHAVQQLNDLQEMGI